MKYHCSRLTSCTWMSRWINSLMSKMMRVNKSLHWQCHWNRLTDQLAHWRDRLWARHCSKLTSCMWMYDQIHWWVKRWKRVDHCIENRCHWSRLTSCMWTDRRINSLIDRVMKKSLHWRCHWNRFTESLLLEIKTSYSSMTDFIWLFNKFKEFLANLNERLIRWSLT